MKNFLYMLSVQVVSWAIILGVIQGMWPTLLPNLGKILLQVL